MSIPLAEAGSARAASELAPSYTTVYSSPQPDHLFAYSPGIAKLPGGRLVATLDLAGGGLGAIPGQRGERYGQWVQGRVYTSDDGGKKWQFRTDFPFMHARPFLAGNFLYVLGHCEDLMVMRSADGGETWSAPVKLTEGQDWTQAPCNVIYSNGCVYLVMCRRMYPHQGYWPVAEEAFILMRGRLDQDLRQAENWTMASPLTFKDIVSADQLNYFGVPFFEAASDTNTYPSPGRAMAPLGWLEAHVVQFKDPNHLWTDASGKTFHLFGRAHTGGTGYAAMAKVVEEGPVPGTGAMTTLLEKAPSGKTMLYLPMPGGHMKFHVTYDEKTGLYWLLSTQATDSMIRPDKMPPDRYNLPNNQRSRLQLHFSRNMVDWCFAGIVALGPEEKAARHYAAMEIDGNDLVILSRSGDERAHSSHDVNLITFHRVRNFRRLVY